jgi:hypothetical protein
VVKRRHITRLTGSPSRGEVRSSGNDHCCVGTIIGNRWPTTSGTPMWRATGAVSDAIVGCDTTASAPSKAESRPSRTAVGVG